MQILLFPAHDVLEPHSCHNGMNSCFKLEEVVGGSQFVFFEQQYPSEPS